VDAAELGVLLLENCKLYNAGKGRCSTARETNRRVGSVVRVTRTKNPTICSGSVSACIVLDKGAHLLLAGKAADEIAEICGLPLVQNPCVDASFLAWDALIAGMIQRDGLANRVTSPSK
jgi:isoaspartyl peptidase/L-asparaginase-like protein (Ntn-hydrolase superfamily)